MLPGDLKTQENRLVAGRCPKNPVPAVAPSCLNRSASRASDSKTPLAPLLFFDNSHTGMCYISNFLM